MSDILKIAGGYVGETEIRGAKHNPKILEMFKKSGNAWVDDDETPWCAAFVGAVLDDVGLEGTMKLNARSYLDWGTPVDEPQAGDVVVLWRGKKNGWQGHVGFFVRFEGSFIVIMGGNQGDAVSVKKFGKTRLLGYRRSPPLSGDIPRTNLMQSTTQQAVGVASVATVAGASDQLKTIVGNVTETFGLDPKYIFVLVVLLALGWVFRRRLQRWTKGDR